MKSILIFILLFFFNSCNGSHEMIRLEEKDNGGKIKLKGAEVFELALESHSTAGYRWVLMSMDSNIVKEVTEQRFEQKSKRLGAPGRQIFKFIAVSSGETALKLIYHRPWEKDAAPLDTYNIVVKVSK